MKHNFLRSFLTVVTGSALLLGTSCKKLEDFGDTDVNPAGSIIPVTSALLTNAQIGVGGIVGGTGVRGGLFVQYFSETQYTDASLYSEPKIDFGGQYAGSMSDLYRIIKRNTDPETRIAHLVSGTNENQIAVSKILLAYSLWSVTDRWGDVPFSEAFQGIANLTPAYDSQEELYMQILTDLKDAVATFDNGGAEKNYVVGDIFYGGDPTKKLALPQQAHWKKLANTLRMLVSIRLSKVYPNAGGLAATEFAAAASDPAGFISSNSDNLTIKYDGKDFKHPWFNLYDGRTDYAYSKTLSDLLNNMTDGRRASYGGSGSSFPYGLERVDATTLPTNYAKVLAAAYQDKAASSVVVSAASSLLTVAEGIERGWISSAGSFATAKAAYDAGITESFAQWGQSGAASVIAGAGNYDGGTGGGSNLGANTFNSVLNQSAITVTKLERIFLQKYIADYPDGVQAWADWRRSCAPGMPSTRTDLAGMPNLAPTTYATNSGNGIPRRYVYGANESSTNPASLAAAVSHLAIGNVAHDRVWWDK